MTSVSPLSSNATRFAKIFYQSFYFLMCCRDNSPLGNVAYITDKRHELCLGNCFDQLARSATLSVSQIP